MRKLAVATRVQFEWLATGRGKMSIAVEGQGDDASSALVLNYYAHDEVEERMLIALRKLDYWQSVLLAEHAEGLAAGKLKG